MNKSQQPIELSNQRLDRWLWVARIYKTRSLASDAVSAGHVLVNDGRAKPGKVIRSGDCLTIRKNQEQYLIHVLRVTKSRLSATLAANLYRESAESRQQRLQARELRKLNRSGVRYDQRKPGKRDRQQMLKIKNQQTNST